MNKRKVKRDVVLLFELTPRELEIIDAICVKGIFERKKLANYFNLALATINAHIVHIYSKLNVHSFAELVFWYYTKRNKKC